MSNERYWVTAAQLSIIETVVCGPKTKPQKAPEIFTAVLDSIRTGAMTEYAESCGGTARCGGSGIKPITAEQAYEWLEAHAQPELVEAHFADRIQEA
jgi:hypothetical protein